MSDSSGGSGRSIFRSRSKDSAATPEPILVAGEPGLGTQRALGLGGDTERPLLARTAATVRLLLIGATVAAVVALMMFLPLDGEQTKARIDRAEAPAEPAPAPNGAPDTQTLAVLSALGAAPPVAEQEVPNEEMAALTSGILLSLGAAPLKGAGGDAELDTLNQSVLAGLAIATGKADEPAAKDLSTLVAQAVRSESGDSYLDEILNKAAQDGLIAVPDALRTADGRVDTRTLLSALTAATGSPQQPDPKPAANPLANLTAIVDTSAAPAAKPAAPAAAPVPAAVRTSVVPKDKPTSYTVKAGDSLAGIALRFYGTSLKYKVIYEANRAQLGSADVIRAGQELALP